MPRLILTDKVPERQQVETLADIDRVTRERWSNVAAEAIRQVLAPTPVALLELIALGPDEFERVARPVLNVHAFRQDDYRRMFEKLKRAAGRLEAQGVSLSPLVKL